VRLNVSQCGQRAHMSPFMRGDDDKLMGMLARQERVENKRPDCRERDADRSVKTLESTSFIVEQRQIGTERVFRSARQRLSTEPFPIKLRPGSVTAAISTALATQTLVARARLDGWRRRHRCRPSPVSRASPCTPHASATHVSLISVTGSPLDLPCLRARLQTFCFCALHAISREESRRQR
jgi:hypothetical protein